MRHVTMSGILHKYQDRFSWTAGTQGDVVRAFDETNFIRRM